VQPDVSNCAAWWKLGLEEEAVEIADSYGSSPLSPAPIHQRQSLMPVFQMFQKI
jgi:hypothetical protein